MQTHALALAAAAVIALTPATRAAADAGDFVAGAIVGAIVNHAARNAPRRTVTRSRTYARPRIPATQEGRMIQSSLNYFGFNAGRVDGQLGQRSRNAISSYQAYLGYPATGSLSPFEQDLLITSYQRAQAGGYAVQQQIAASPDGTRGLLRRYRAEMAGEAAAPGTTMVAVPAVPMVPAAPAVPAAPGATTMVVAPAVPAAPATTTTTTTTTTVAAPAQPEEAEDPGTPGLPNLFGGRTVQASLASHCNKVSLLTNTNGGFTTLASMTDPGLALNEQFCLARTYAISEGEELGQKLSVTPEQLAQVCDAYGAQMRGSVAALSLKPRDEVLRDVSGLLLQSGISAQDLGATAKVCLSVGYRKDDMNVAIGSALILVALGEKGYGELLGHHLSQGFGASERADLALAWYETGIEAAENGKAVFSPGQPERTELIRKAAFSLGGQAGAAPAQAATPKTTLLPAFTIDN